MSLLSGPAQEQALLANPAAFESNVSNAKGKKAKKVKKTGDGPMYVNGFKNKKN